MHYFIKWPEAYIIPDQEKITIGVDLIRNWIPRLIHSDQGTNHNSRILQEIHKTLDMVKTRTTILHSQSDVMVERFNRTTLNQFSIFVTRKQADWVQHLPLFLLAYQSAIHESTGYVPSITFVVRDHHLPSVYLSDNQVLFLYRLKSMFKLCRHGCRIFISLLKKGSTLCLRE
ncbi:retrovirus-related Pol polyprotein from transposon 412 [Trichonephila inaurata madagascariensis]|uniref:Retrovirus-related Pol polyprotein from transposon 412 n=1 Tax=Trichonephila inaurata madagascariensis TaxID=2747483 RepID=A0A8X7C349_9ARAC|nr:retrovirus-related Pol polyprotein from transposon 412 [Trichonephila inaurata madagascariensis]